MTDKKIIVYLFWGICFTAMVFGLTGCGKKGAPLPPIVKGNQIAAPYDLKYKVTGDILVLRWKYKSDQENARVLPQNFEVFLSKKTFEACEGCPFKFERIAAVPMPEMTHTLRVEKGFKYYFRVQAVNGKKLRSEYSKTVLFENR